MVVKWKWISKFLLLFSTGKFCDEVLCDVVSMQASHLLLDKPWQYDKRVINDGVKNRYSFEMKERKTYKCCISLTPKQIYEEQLKLKKKKMAENESLYIKKTFFAN